MFNFRRPTQRRFTDLNRPRHSRVPRWGLFAAILILAPFCTDWLATTIATGQETSPPQVVKEAVVSEEAATRSLEGESAAIPSVPGETNSDQVEHPANDATESAHPPAIAGHGDSQGHVSEHGGGHDNVAAKLFAAIVLILLLAKILGDLFERIGMPAVLGELTVGILLGNVLFLTGLIPGIEPWGGLEFLKAPDAGTMGDVYSTGAALKMLAEIGVVLLLFEVGLESNVRDMMKVGVSSLLVAVLGVIAPMILGLVCGWVFLRHEPWPVWLFLGATLCATSVGITARVLKDLHRSQQRESQIILGAAVIDDVLGLIILTVVTGIITTIDRGEAFNIVELGMIVAKSVGFLLVAVLLGANLFVKPLFKMASFLRGHGLLVSTSLVICFGLAYLANLVGLAPIVGAFAAGLILEKAHYQDLGRKEHVDLETSLAPLTALLVPIFFVQMGIMVSLESFANPNVWLLAAAITVAAVLGKQVCSLGVIEKSLNKMAIGLGMIPRGEVGLIFAGVGLGLSLHGKPIVSQETYSAIIVMVILTTMVTPPLLKWSLNQSAPAHEPEPALEGSS